MSPGRTNTVRPNRFFLRIHRRILHVAGKQPAGIANHILVEGIVVSNHDDEARILTAAGSAGLLVDSSRCRGGHQ